MRTLVITNSSSLPLQSFVASPEVREGTKYGVLVLPGPHPHRHLGREVAIHAADPFSCSCQLTRAARGLDALAPASN